MGIGLLLILFNSCDKDEIKYPVDADEVILTFSAKLPGVPLGGLKTYALTSTDENLLEDIDVLVFTDDGSGMKFRYRSVGTVVEQSTGISVPAEIKVRLWRTDVDSRLVIIANARQQVNDYDFEIGVTTPEDVQQGLVYAIDTPDGKWLADDGNFTPLPMWGQPDDIEDGINGEIVLGNVTLLRSLARVDVVVDENADDFVLTEVWVFNGKSNGLIIPHPDNLVAGVAQSPSLPSGGPSNNDAPLVYPTDGENSVGEIYLFEADDQAIGDEEATALLIGGIYAGNPNPTYFRIDFRDPDNSNLPYPVLRNRQYLITITGASGTSAGDDDPIVAFGKPSISPQPFVGTRGRSTLSMGRTGTVPESTSGITYTVTAIDESQ